jgi:hypothetical protein
MDWVSIIVGALIGIAFTAIVNSLWNLFFFKEVRNKAIWTFAKVFKTKSSITKGIKSEIETYLNKEIELSKKRAFGNDILINENVKIEWVRVEEDEGISFEEGETIIRLGYNMDKTRNYIEAIMRYLDKGFAPATIPFIDQSLRTAFKLEFIHQTMLDRGEKAFRYYNEHYLSQELGNQSIRDLMEKTGLIKRKGFFTPVLLREVNVLCGRLARERKNRTNQLDQEIDEFIDFLYNIADLENYRDQNGCDPPLDFIKPFIKVSIVLVKSRNQQDIIGHKNAVDYAFRNGAKSVYIAGFGANKAVANDVFKNGLSAHSTKYSLIDNGCIDTVIEFEDGIRKEGKICLITRQ